MNRKIPSAWIVVVMAICCVLLAFFFLTSVDPSQPPKTENVKAAAKPASPAMLDDTASRVTVATAAGKQNPGTSGNAFAPAVVVGGTSPDTTAVVAPSTASSGTLPARPKRVTLRASSGGDSAGLESTPPSRAVVKIGRGEIEPPNFSGHYQRVRLERGGKAEIRVEFPQDETSHDVLVRAIHGGKINGGENYAVFDLGRGQKEIAFTFESGGEAGISEVILRRGTTEEVLQFWAPTDQPQYDPPALSVGS